MNYNLDAIKDVRLKIFVTDAERDSYVGQEAAFIAAMAESRSPFIDNEELLHILHYPCDDIEYWLQLYFYRVMNGQEKFAELARKFGIQILAFNRAVEVGDKFKESIKNSRQSYPPKYFCFRIDCVRQYFVETFLHQICVYSGNDDVGFFDYNRAVFLQVSERSAASKYSGLKFSYQAAYFILVCRGKSKFAEFLCVLPDKFRNDMPMSQVELSTFKVGRDAYNSFLKLDKRQIREKCGPFISIIGGKSDKSAITMVHPEGNKEIAQIFVRSHMRKVAENLKEDCRYFWLEQYNAMIIVGPGLEVLGLFMKETNMVLIKPTNISDERKIRELCKGLRNAVPDSRIKICYNKGNAPSQRMCGALVITKNPEQAKELVRQLQTSSNLETELLYYDSDFYGFDRKATAMSENTSEACKVCMNIPENSNFIELAICGHPICNDCALHYLKKADLFPLNCVDRECAGMLTLDDIDIIIDKAGFASQQEFKEMFVPVIDRAISDFLRPGNVMYKRCTNKDCQYIIDPSVTLKRFQVDPGDIASNKETRELLIKNGVTCEGCQSLRCGLCGYECHPTITCEEHYSRTYVLNNEGLLRWRDERPENRRFCPNKECHALIEKEEGCNHMECTHCRKHFCWICNFLALNSREIYQHMDAEHGGHGGNADLIFYM
ncbi:IBR domain, a half RING-finger domain-containing protein [Ditylenchus destructor]|nr:IBR domain, a half RING-finger domain-containing protein [Ditylenchus destructor]